LRLRDFQCGFAIREERAHELRTVPSSPAEIQKAAKEAGLPASVDLPTCDVVDEEIDTGGEARCFASYMRIHALEATGGKTYAEMGRYQSAANPDDQAGTNDEAAAAKDESGNPVPNGDAVFGRTSETAA
jgi:hypothetical protein